MVNENDRISYEKDRENHIKYINEQYKAHNLELVKTEDLKKLKVKKFFSGVLLGICILAGLIILSLSIFYGSYYDKFKSDIICGNSTCSNSCPTNTCPSCNCPSLSCGNLNCSFPNKIEIKYTNST